MLLALLAVAPGTLQLTAGDELGRSQRGNTNAWCQDNEIGWLDWTSATPPSESSGRSLSNRASGFGFVEKLLHLRKDLRWFAVAPSAFVEPILTPASPASPEALSGGGALAIVRTAERGTSS